MNAETSSTPDRRSALEGLVVVDLSSTLASAYTTLVYADFGAEVIQVEPPGGSPLRSQPGWPFWMRGKKSIQLDLHDSADVAVARELCLDADLVVEAWRPGVADRLGLGAEALRSENPALVYCSISGFGSAGPFRDLKGYEAVVMAKTGSMYGPNRSGRQGPVLQPVTGATMAAAFLAIQGSLIALYDRSRGGQGYGQHVRTTLLQGMLAQDPWSYFGPILAQKFPDAFQSGPAPSTANPVPTTWLTFGLLTGYSKDGRWMQFAHATPKQFAAFVAELGMADLLKQDEWKDAPDSEDVELRRRWWDLMLERVAEKTTAEWQAVFDRNSDVFAEIFRSPQELFDHPQIVHDGHAGEWEVEGFGAMRAMGPLVKMAKTPASVDRPPPALDQHGGELRARPRGTMAAPGASAVPSSAPPLDGLVVVDLGTFYAAPFGSAMLADLGARVIKVEPLEGDPIRFNMPVPEWAGMRVTQGKESLAIDLGSDEGKAVVVELIKRADIVMHSYRGGVAKRLGLDAEAMLALNPNLVYHHGQGYGLDGPYARRAAYAPTIAAGSGFAVRSGGGGPERVALSLDERKGNSAYLPGAQSGHPDGFAALGVAAAMALGLLARELGAGGQATLTSMLSTMGHVMGDTLVDYEGRPADPERDPELLGYHALYRLYPSSDGWVVLCATSAREWETLACELEIDRDDRFATPAARSRHDGELIELLSAKLAADTGAEWEARFTPLGVACVEVVPQQGGLASGLHQPGGVGEQHAMMATVEHPLFGTVPRTRALVQFDRSAERLGAGVLIGQHTEAILENDFGYDRDTIAELRAKGVIR